MSIAEELRWFLIDRTGMNWRIDLHPAGLVAAISANGQVLPLVRIEDATKLWNPRPIDPAPWGDACCGG